MGSIDIIFSIAVLIMSVVAHEVSHGYMALFLGDPTAKLAGRLTLNPIKHLDPLGSVVVPLVTALLPGTPVFGWARPVPYNPYNLQKGKWGPALVAAAGPLTNISIAIVFGLVLRFSSQLGITSTAFLGIASIVVFVNIVLAVFNFVPIPPLDGSKVLFALLPYRYHYIRSFLEQNWLIVLGIFIFFLFPVLFPVIGFLFSLIVGGF
jgi:Zn-dependent protease